MGVATIICAFCIALSGIVLGKADLRIEISKRTRFVIMIMAIMVGVIGILAGAWMMTVV